jgi:Flp pilus assembly protein TadD
MRRDGRRTSASWWQRRYVLRHYRRWRDAELAASSGLPVSVVSETLRWHGAIRSAGDERRIVRRGRASPPWIFTPGNARRALTRCTSRPLDRTDAVLLAAMLIGSVALYAATAARTVTGEDAGELLAAAHTLGVPHPPGYPLWTLLGWAADHGLPFGTVALRVTLVSVVCSALANTLLLALALKTVASRLAACAAAALFAVSVTHWTQATIPEVYALNTFFLALCALLLLRLAERPTPARLLSLAAVTGLSCTNHTTAFPVAALLLLGAILTAPVLFRRPGLVAAVLLAGLLPLGLYAYLPLASARDPFMDWGNPETASAFWEHVTRQQYATVELGQQASTSYVDYLRRLGIVADSAAEQFGSGWVLLLAFVGFVALLPKQTGPTLFFLVIGYLCSVGVTKYAAFPFGREHVQSHRIFWIPAWFALAWLMAGGFDAVASALRRLPQRARSGAQAAATAGLAALVAVPGVAHSREADKSGTTHVRAYSQAVLDTMEEGALYFTDSDHSTFGVLYLQGVEGQRPDIVVADRYGHIERDVLEPFLGEDERRALADARGADRRRVEEAILIDNWPGPIYLANRRDMSDLPGFSAEPVGPLFQVMTAEEAAAWWAAPDDGGLPPGLLAWQRLDPLLDVEAAQRVDMTVQIVLGDLLYSKGFAQLRAGRVQDAITTWSRINFDRAPVKQVYNNIGSALAEHGRSAEALTFYQRALDEDPRYAVPLHNVVAIHKRRGELTLAIAALQRLLEVEPENRAARFDRAHLLERQERPIEALHEYEVLALADSRDPRAWREAGQLLHRLGDLGKAEEAYSQALKRDPSQLDVSEWRARIRGGIAQLAIGGDSPTMQDEHAHAPAPPPPWAVPRVPGLPADPSDALRFDPMRAGRP